MIIGLGIGFWVCLSLVDVLLLSFCFLSGFSECVASFTDLLSQCVHGECLLVLEAGEGEARSEMDCCNAMCDPENWGTERLKMFYSSLPGHLPGVAYT